MNAKAKARSILLCIAACGVACMLTACESETTTATTQGTPAGTSSEIKPLSSDGPQPEPAPDTPFSDGPPSNPTTP